MSNHRCCAAFTFEHVTKTFENVDQNKFSKKSNLRPSDSKFKFNIDFCYIVFI